MMKNTGYILALCLTASGHVLAHDVWITGKQAENNITAEIGYGHNFPSKGTIPDRRNFFENPRIYVTGSFKPSGLFPPALQK